jgi:hypothetical protein
MKPRIFIGISGVARSGKNLCADLLIKQLRTQYNVEVSQYALADALKLECKEFIQTNLELDVFTSNTKLKAIFRPMLVWLAAAKKQIYGQYWIKKMEKKIAEDTTSDVIIITDIRHTETDDSDMQWLKNTLGGSLIHVTKYEILPDGSEIEQPYPNDAEKLNDPVLKQNADYLLRWVDIRKSDPPYQGDVMDSEYLNALILKCLDQLQIHQKIRYLLSSA